MASFEPIMNIATMEMIPLVGSLTLVKVKNPVMNE
jgi:hypothetical protein